MVTKLAKDAWLSKKLTSLVCYKPILRKAVIIPKGQKREVNIILHLYFKTILCNSFLSLHLLQDLHPVWPTNQTNSCPWHHLVGHHYILYSCSLFDFAQNWPSLPWSFSFLLIFVAFKQYRLVMNVKLKKKTLPRFSHGPINIKKAKQALSSWPSHSSHKYCLQNRSNIYVNWKAINFFFRLAHRSVGSGSKGKPMTNTSGVYWHVTY